MVGGMFGISQNVCSCVVASPRFIFGRNQKIPQRHEVLRHHDT